MSAAASAGTGKRYGVKRVCGAWELNRSSWYAKRRRAAAAPVGKRGPKTAHNDAQLLEAVRADLAASPFNGEGHRKVWARLRVAGIRTSKPRVLRLMRENGLLAPARAVRCLGPRHHDGTIIPEAPDLMWGTDFTSTVTLAEGQAAVFVCVDHFSAELLGVHAAKRATRWEALEPMRQAVRAVFGAIGQDIAKGLALRHDHGTQYLADDFQAEIAFLGIESSPAFVRAPEGNGCAERIIRTLKEQLLWVRAFDTVEELRQALKAWQQTYNERWLIERHGHRSPAQVRRDHYAKPHKQAA
jgi:putative transposase